MCTLQYDVVGPIQGRDDRQGKIGSTFDLKIDMKVTVSSIAVVSCVLQDAFDCLEGATHDMSMRSATEYKEIAFLCSQRLSSSDNLFATIPIDISKST